MRALLLHPEDDATRGPWSQQHWDQIFDLGVAGAPAYERWSQELNCPVEPSGKISDGDFARMRDALDCGLGLLIDDHGLDWWALLALDFHQKLEQIAVLKKLLADVPMGVHWFATRPCFQANVLEIMSGSAVRSFANGNVARRARHYLRTAVRLSPAQVLQILGDKYDAGYRLRRHFAPAPKIRPRPVVLLPSAYVNVSRTELQYADMLPDTDFLLVTTRKSGWVDRPPKNVTMEKLASYALPRRNEIEINSLLDRWAQLKRSLMSQPLMSVLFRTGELECMPKMLRTGLLVRDAWLQVFEKQNISSVLCADDGNRFTQLPLLIAAKRGVPAIACHHGALDGRHRIRPRQDYAFLAKGRMERDYMVRECGVPPERVEVGAGPRPRPRPSSTRRSIIFFSEPYEVAGGRGGEFYAQILPPLSDVAQSLQCDLIVKLHPFESERQRNELVKSALSLEQRKRARIVSGALTDELLGDALCAVTILSTIAVECTLRGIPVFLCEWLDYSHYGYLQQFAKFGAGAAIQSAEELRRIPARLSNLPAMQMDDLSSPIPPERLRSLLFGCATMAVAV